MKLIFMQKLTAKTLQYHLMLLKNLERFFIAKNFPKKSYKNL